MRCLLLGLLLLPMGAQALPITYRLSGKADFTLGGASYVGQEFTFVSEGDTDDVVSFAPPPGDPFPLYGARQDFISSTFSFPDGTVSVPGLRLYVTAYEVAADIDTLSLSAPDDGDLQLAISPSPTSPFQGYGLTTDLGPVTRSAFFYANADDLWVTSGGGLRFDITTVGPLTFTSTVAPLPTAGLLLATSLLAAARLTRRRR